MTFSEMDVTVTMRGEEWFTIMAQLARRDLSLKGKTLLKSGLKKMQEQVVAASDANPEVQEPRTAAGSLD